MTARFPGSDTKYLGNGLTYGPLPDHGYTNLKVALHTTETAGMPGFGSNGDTAPHYVYDATNKKWFVWSDVDKRVGTMKGHSTNHCNCDAIQVEILGYSDDRWSPWVGDFDDTDYNELARFFRWAIDEGFVEPNVTVEPAGGWQYGTTSPYRMSVAEWHEFSGLTVHGNAPQNTHWDTGVLDLARIHSIATDGAPIEPPVDPPPTGDEYMFPTLRHGDGVIDGPTPHWRGAVVGLQQMLAYHGHADRNSADKSKCAADGAFLDGTKVAVESFQSAKALHVDGICGPATWALLIDRK